MPFVTYNIPSNRAVKCSLGSHKALNRAHLGLVQMTMFLLTECILFDVYLTLASWSRQALKNICLSQQNYIEIGILSAICMPLTLIAGIYGMNFNRMPELKATWGYPATLIAMALIVIGQLWFFYKRGWFR